MSSFFSQSQDDFNEADYLAANPDVAKAVQAGLQKSGRDHYLRHGKKEGRPLKSTSNIALNNYVTHAPSPAAAFELFAGEWASDVPGVGFGKVNLFDDSRIGWLSEQCGGFQGKRILELGPLEAGHTYMLEKAGASHITSIESNVRAFTKCLIVKNALGLKTNFLLGDFRPYLSETADRFDFALASGVMYHMTDPVAFLDGLARVSDSIGIWTHYYDDSVLGMVDGKFDADPEVQIAGGMEIKKHKQRYLAATDTQAFCGGNEPYSYWLEKESILSYLETLGFSILGSKDLPNPNGPSILLFAKRS